MEYVLGIDIGTGSVKAVAVNLEGRSFGLCQQHYSFSSPKSGYHEQDPKQIWNAFKASIQGIIQKTGSQPLAICLSSAMHSLIAVDKNGLALAPMITWADNRSAAIAQDLRSSARGLAIYEATGTPLHAMSPLCKIIWIRENNTELFYKTFKFISIKEYIWYKLFNEFTIDHSIASCTGLFDICQRIWHTDALDVAGIDAERLSTPVATNYYKNYSPSENSTLSFLEPGLPFIIGASDGCLASLGTMANKPGIATITIGTSGAVRVASNRPLPNTEAMTFSYILDKGIFICGGPINNGGLALQWWLKNKVSREPTNQDYKKLFQQIAGVSAGSEGLIFLPYLTGERAPIWDSESCGTFFGVRLKHTQSHFSRAVVEGICYALKDVLDAVHKNAEPIKQINVSGGIINAPIWLQILTDITNTKMVITQTEDASAVGAAFMALQHIGIKEYAASRKESIKTYLPNKFDADIYSENFVFYKQIYGDLKETMHKFMS